VREIILFLKSILKESQQLTTGGSNLITELASSRFYPYFYEFANYNKLCERQELEQAVTTTATTALSERTLQGHNMEKKN
jgi:hypothetical protein